MKKIKLLKKVALVVSAAMLSFAVTACGSGNSAEEQANKASKDYVYKGEEIPFDINTDNVSATFTTNNRIYFLETVYSDVSSTSRIISFDLTGNDKKSFPIVFENNGYAGTFSADDQGNVYGIVTESYEDATDPENILYAEDYYLTKWSSTGEQIWKIKMNQLPSSEEYFYAGNITVSGDKIIVMSGIGLLVYDTESNLIKTIGDSTSSFGNLYKLKDGSLMVSVYGEVAQEFYKVDIEAGTIGTEKITFPGTAYNYTFYQGYNYDFYLADSMGVYGFNIGDTQLTQLMNYIDSDLDSSNLFNIVGISDTEFFAAYSDNLTYKNVYMKFTKVPAEEVVDKEVITLACYYLDYTVRSHVVEFNKTSDTYRISITDYSKYDTETDYTAGITKLNTDIVSGNIPDIIIINNQLPTKSYMEKGLFEDLNTYIDNDEELNRDDYLANIFETFSVNGKMYQLVPSFSAFTVIGKTADVGAETGWTIEDLNQVLATKSPDIAVFPEVNRDSILSYSMQMSGDQFINWETGECTFNSQGFVDLLEFVEQFPEEFDYSIYDDTEYWNNYESMYREGSALLSTVYLSDFATYNYQKKGTFGEDITFIGFPSSNKNGSAIDYNLSFAMSSKSDKKDGVWDFLRYYLTDDYQNSITYGFPISIERLNALAETAKQRPFYLDENNNKVEYDQTYYLDGVEIVIEPCTDAEIDQVMTFLKSLNQSTTYDSSLMNIISEEAGSFFSGQKTASEVAEIIQSRVQIYVSENM